MNKTKESTKMLVLLTPELAKQYLDRNYSENRDVRPSNVLKLATDILSGRWNEALSYVQDPIIFTDEDIMINGQHRCLAVIKANKAVNVWVQYGVHDPDKKLFKALDSGCVRQAKDFLDGPNKNSCAAAAKVFVALSKGEAPLLSAIQGKMEATGKSRADVGRAEIIEAYEADPDYFQTLHNLGRSIGKLWNKNSGAFRDALMIIDFVGKGDFIDRFVEDFSSQMSTNRTIAACKSYMTKCFMDKNFNSSNKWVISCVLAAYDNFAEGKELACFNKSSIYLSKYDKLLNQKRKELRMEVAS